MPKSKPPVPVKAELPAVVQINEIECITLENLMLKLNSALRALEDAKRQCGELQNSILHKRGQISQRLGGLDLSLYHFDNNGLGTLKPPKE